MSSENQQEVQQSTADPMPEVADVIVSKLAFDGKALLNLSKSSRFWRNYIKSNDTWGSLNRGVFGLQGPLAPPAGDGAPAPEMLRYFELSRRRLLVARDVTVAGVDDYQRWFVRIPDPVPRWQALAASVLQQDGSYRRWRKGKLDHRFRVPWDHLDHPVPGLDLELGAGDGASPGGQSAPGAEPAPVLVVELQTICWMQLVSRFYGLPPGRYRCVWRLLVSPACNVSGLDSKIKLAGVRPVPSGFASTSTSATTEGGGVNAKATAAAAPALATSAPAAVGSELCHQLVPSEELKAHAGAGIEWHGYDCGSFEVPYGQVYDIEAELWGEGGDLCGWKTGLMFKEVLLERVEEGEGANGGGDLYR